MKARAITRTSFGARCATVLGVLAIAVVGAAPASAIETGGANTTASSDAQTGKNIAFSPLRSAGATWYGPGLYGNQTACVQTLRQKTMGVAHRSLPCGTAVKFVHEGRAIVTRVIDRGPFTRGYAWDLTNGVREALGFEGAGRIRFAVQLQLARP